MFSLYCTSPNIEPQLLDLSTAHVAEPTGCLRPLVTNGFGSSLLGCPSGWRLGIFLPFRSWNCWVTPRWTRQLSGSLLALCHAEMGSRHVPTYGAKVDGCWPWARQRGPRGRRSWCFCLCAWRAASGSESWWMSPPSSGPRPAAVGTWGHCGTGSCLGPSVDTVGGKTALHLSLKSLLEEQSTGDWSGGLQSRCQND